MTLRVVFPGVMKMYFSTVINTQGCTTIPAIKERIFNEFWKVMGSISSIGPHGDASLVVLKQGKEEIKDIERLFKIISEKEKPDSPLELQVVFQKHPEIGLK